MAINNFLTYSTSTCTFPCMTQFLIFYTEYYLYKKIEINKLLYFLRSQLRQSFFRDMARMIFFKIIFFRKRKRRKKTTNTKNYDDPIIFSNYPTKIRNFISNPISTPLQAGNKGGKNRSSRFPMA